DMVLRESQMKMQAGSQAGTQQDEEKPLTVTEDSVSSEPSVAASSSPASVSAEAPAQPSHDALRELPIPQKPPPPPEMPPPQPPEPVGVMPVYGRVDPDLSAETMDGTLAGNSFPPPPWQSPSPATPFYRSRPLWILAIVMLLGGTFLIVRNSGSLL